MEKRHAEFEKKEKTKNNDNWEVTSMCAGSVWWIHTCHTNCIMRYSLLRHCSMPYHRVRLAAVTATERHTRRFLTSNIKPYKCKYIALPPVYENKFRAWHFIGSQMCILGARIFVLFILPFLYFGVRSVIIILTYLKCWVREYTSH